MGSGHVHSAPLSATFLGRLDARAKILAVVPAVFLVNVLPPRHWPWIAAVGAVFLALLVLCGPRSVAIVKRALYMAPFLIFFLVTLPFSGAGSELFEIPLGITTLVATDEGLARTGEVALKAGTSILGVLILSGTTEAPALFAGLASLGLPRAFVAVMAIVYRYIFEMGNDLSQVRRAAAARGFRVRNLSAVPMLSRMASATLIRSVVRTQKVHHAMLARGFDGEVRTLSRTRFGAREAAALFIFYAAIAAAALMVGHA